MDRIISGFSDRGSWYRGNLHSHTTVSDGVLTPEESVKAFREHGYSFLCISDHNTYTDFRKKFNDKRFIILPGMEASAVLYDQHDTCIKVHHINGILGTQEMQDKASRPLFNHMEAYGPFVYHEKWDGLKAAQEIIDDLHARGCFVTYNHPVWSRVEREEFMDLQHIDMLEIFNYNTQNESGTRFDTNCWDGMLRKGMVQNADAADDNHNGGIFDDAFGGYIMVKAEELTQDAIVSAIMNGSYYSTSGPEIYDWELNENQVNVRCSNVERINLIADGFVGAGITVIAENGKMINACSIPIQGTEHYVRLECIDEKGRTAWTNPIFTGR